MNLRLWFRIFMNQVLFLFTILLAFLIGLIYGLKVISLDIFWGLRLWSVPIYLVLGAGIVSLSAVYAAFLVFRIMEPFESVRAKINWLLLGKYQHPIFKEESFKARWYDQTICFTQEMNHLRDKMVQLSKDLQELSAAPIFVGEDTREEIIEQERHRIARELHDSVSQQLFAATMMTSAVNEQLDESISPALTKQLRLIEDVIGNAQTEMRALLLHLRPVELANKSLNQGIELLLQELQTKIPMDLRWKLDNVKLETGIEDHLFRICQEAISNTLRHAKAKKLEVYLSKSQDNVHLKIMDDGQGFDVEATHQTGRYGLMNIRDRVASMGGVCKIISRKNQGTVIDITVPMPEPIKRGEN